MSKNLLSLIILSILVFSFAGCTPQGQETAFATKAASTEAPDTTAPHITSAAETEAAPAGSEISVVYLKADDNDGNYEKKYTLNSEYAVPLLFTVNRDIENFNYYLITFEADSFSRSSCFESKALPSGYTFVLDFEQPGAMPSYGFSYTDKGGVTHAYTLAISGEDGSLTVSEDAV